MRLATDCRPAMVLTLLYVGRREGLGHERTRPTTNAGYEPGAREKWMRILFVHPEGNLANNPNLSAIIELLTRAGHEIILRSRRGSFAGHENPNVRVLEVRYRIQRKLMQLSCHPRKWSLGKLLITLVPPMTPPADLVVGVDRQGLIEGAVIARSKGIPLAYWSYEIFFTTESSSNFKALERREASSVRFAVAQDDLVPCPTGLVKPPHRHADGDQTPEQSCRAPALPRVLRRDDRRRHHHGKGNEVAKRRAEVRARNKLREDCEECQPTRSRHESQCVRSKHLRGT